MGLAGRPRSFQQGKVAMIQEESPFGGPFMDPEQSTVASEDKLACFVIPAGPVATRPFRRTWVGDSDGI